MKEYVGRIVSKKRKGKILFFIITNHESTFQLVVKNDDVLLSASNELGIGDIIRSTVQQDISTNSRYKPQLPSYQVNSIELISRRTVTPPQKYDAQSILLYYSVKQKIRQYLIEKNYIEVNVPVLTDGETSSDAKSYETYSRSGKKLFLRKTMDTFLRIYSCLDFNHIFCIGPCFRNCFPTAKSISEFEMLSVFSNYQSFEESIRLAKDLLYIVLGNNIVIRSTTLAEYEELEDLEGIWLITGFLNEKNSYAAVVEDGFCDEFKIRINGVTVMHGVQEISNIESYKRKIEEQGKKEQYGELVHLEDALQYGAPPCYNIGFSIIRTLALFNHRPIIDYDIFAISRLNQEMKRRINPETL